MTPRSESGDIARFDVRNVGGIDHTEVELSPGVSVLTGKNATNRTSFLQAIIAAMGSTAATLKGDADAGRVRLDLDGETYERHLERVGDDTRFTGKGYLDDASVAELFAFLLESNEARQSVATGGDLRELLMRPVDTEAIRADIERLEVEKAELTERLSAIEDRKHELADLEARRDDLTDRIEAKRRALAEKEAEIDETDIKKHRQDRSEFEETLSELRSTRSELETVRRNIESQSESIASLRQERAELKAELDDLSTEPGPDGECLDREIRELRSRRQSLNAEISELQGIVQYNEKRLEDGELGELAGQTDGGNGAVSEELVPTDSDVVCWTCGSTVEREQIESTVDRLKQLREERVAELESVKSALAERTAEKQAREDGRRRRREIEAKLGDIESEQERRETRLAQLKRRRGELTEEVGELETTVQSLESAEFDTVLALHREANQLEFELDRLESDREDVLEEIAEIETALDRAETLRERRETVVEELTEERTRIDRLEQDAVEAFNEHMAAVLDILGYDNVERIWIERLQPDDEGSTFDLHIVRTTANGTVYEDTVSHLSESERTVTGLVFALAGYLVHELHETVPFVLLDSLEAIDADRIAALVDYLADHADYLVVALLPEDAQALDDSYTRIRSI